MRRGPTTVEELGFAAALVVEVEVSEPVAPIAPTAESGHQYQEVWLLVRVFGEAVGLVQHPMPERGLSADEVMAAIRGQCGDVVVERLRECGAPVDPVWSGRGTEPVTVPAFHERHRAWAQDGPDITVVVCTRDRPDDLSRALESLAAQSYPKYSVLVVDNAPRDPETKRVVERASRTSMAVRYAVEPRPGLSWARNTALALVATPLVAWLDDDETADPHWLMEIIGAFLRHPGISAVSGFVVPAELATLPQYWFEQYGGHSKGRGFTAEMFGHGAPSTQSPLYPLPPFGVGANMAFDVAELRAVGGFDTALGAGTVTAGGEDTLVFTQLLLAGGRVAYEPSAVTRHFHRRDYEALAKQMRGYGVGLTAFYTSLVRSDWRLAFALIRLAPRALQHSLGRGGTGEVGPGSLAEHGFPQELVRLKTLAMLSGPLAYARARRAAKALARSEAGGGVPGRA